MKNVDHNKNADAMSNGDGSMAPWIVGGDSCSQPYSMTLLYMSCFNHVYYRLDV